MEKQVTENTVCIHSENVVAREIEGDLIIVPLVAGIGDVNDELFTLNETGKAIWKKMDGEKSLEKISVELTEDFSSSAEEIKADVLGFASEMVRRGIMAIKN
jgi:hypothetical protein